eukprot:Skav201492  [mRNA]  locus=scaffold1996:14906:22031:- [translate_table: standard]
MVTRGGMVTSRRPPAAQDSRRQGRSARQLSLDDTPTGDDNVGQQAATRRVAHHGAVPDGSVHHHAGHMADCSGLSSAVGTTCQADAEITSAPAVGSSCCQAGSARAMGFLSALEDGQPIRTDQ